MREIFFGGILTPGSLPEGRGESVFHRGDTPVRCARAVVCPPPRRGERVRVRARPCSDCLLPGLLEEFRGAVEFIGEVFEGVREDGNLFGGFSPILRLTASRTLPGGFLLRSRVKAGR